MSTPGQPSPFYVRAYNVNQAEPYYEEPHATFGQALDRAMHLASALTWRSVVVMDLNNMMFVQLNMLWSIPRELR